VAVVIAGDRSGSGKTTVTLALLAAIAQRRGAGCRVQSFKVGPDYIDPMFHQRITGRPCRNLDPVLTSEDYVRRCFAQHSQTAAFSLIEGVMGLFDGAGATDTASTAHIARLLELPVILVVDCSRLSRSIAAILHGYRSFDPRVRIVGVVLNRVGSDRHLELLKMAIAPLQIPVVGVLRRQAEIQIRDRHLGLVPVEELAEWPLILDRLADLGLACFDWRLLDPLLDAPSSLSPATGIEIRPLKTLKSRLRVAIAQDEAFNFYYADNLELLSALGAELVPWSPLRDGDLPSQVQGLYFGGGFPEQFAAELATNEQAKAAVQGAIALGMPTYAECGGLMYLSQAVQDFEQTPWPMVGVLPTQTRMGDRLTLGYRRATPQRDSCLVQAQQSLWGHEFHRSQVVTELSNPLYCLTDFTQRLSGQAEGWGDRTLHASYVHLHWGAMPQLPTRFLHHCAAYAQAQSEEV
jgi:cobyrinic acid a,c-diamide synthase